MEKTKVNAYDWPCYEDGKPVKIGDVLAIENGYICVAAIEFYYDHDKNRMSASIKDGKDNLWSNRIIVTPDYRFKRPVVLAADEKPLVEGEIVYSDATGEPYSIDRIMMKEDGNFLVKVNTSDLNTRYKSPDELTHEKPVFDVDGVPIKVGDTVYFTDGREQECNTVVHAQYDYKDDPYVQLGRLNDVGYPTYTNCSCIDPSQLTHTKPEPPDTLERIKADLDKPICEYFGFSKKPCSDGCPAFDIEGNCGDVKNADIVRRLKALFEKDA